MLSDTTDAFMKTYDEKSRKVLPWYLATFITKEEVIEADLYKNFITNIYNEIPMRLADLDIYGTIQLVLNTSRLVIVLIESEIETPDYIYIAFMTLISVTCARLDFVEINLEPEYKTIVNSIVGLELYNQGFLF